MLVTDMAVTDMKTAQTYAVGFRDPIGGGIL